jgi:hypothetical protein
MRTRTRTAPLALSAALAVVAAGCGSNKSCTDATPEVSAVPASCSAVAGASVTVPLHVCPRCDQSFPACDVHPLNGSQLVLEPVSQVCDPNSSCPLVDPASCPFSTLNCTFTAPGPGTYQLVVVTPEGATQRDLVVVASGSTSCGF